MTDALPDRIQCLVCSCSMRAGSDGRYTHSGKRGAACTCTVCEGKFHTEFEHKRNLSARERRAQLDRTAVEPAAAVMDSSSVQPSPAPVTPPESVAATVLSTSGDEGAVAAVDAVQEALVMMAPVVDPPGTKRISNSEIYTFKRCKRKWWLGYYRRLSLIKPEYAGPRAHGTKMHLVLAQFYNPGPLCLNQTAAALTLNALYKEDVERLAETVTYENETYVREMTENLQKELELSSIMLTGFFEWIEETGVDADLEIVAAEQAIEYPLAGFDVPVIIQGKLDVRARRARDNAIVFLDWKNVGSISDTVKQLPLNEQFTMYMLLERLIAPEGEHVASALVSMLRKVKRTASAKPPFFARVEVPRSQTELRNFWSRLHGEIRDILRLQAELDAGADPLMVAYPTPDRSCSWSCDYFEICPMFDDGTPGLEDYITSNYEVSDPYARYQATMATDE